MNYSPSLTWMHLFPGGVSWESASAPPWLSGMLGKKKHNGRRAVAAFKKAMPDAAQLRELFGFAGVNCRGATEQNMRAAGFEWVQRYAVLPSLERARWFIPLDSPTVASAAFSLFTPARLSARIKLAAVKLATKTRLPLWYRDEIVLAQRTPPGLHALAKQLFPGHEIRLAFSAGAPKPARNRKPSFVVLDTSGELLAFGKVAASGLSHRLMLHEAEMLEALVSRVPATMVPKLIFAGEMNGTFVTLQKPLPGSVPPTQLTSGHRHLLTAMQIGPIKPAAETAMVSALEARIGALPAPRPELMAALDQILPILRNTEVPSTIVHGDFAPWNLREHNGGLAAFDWEYGQLDGVPMQDELQFTLQVGLELGGWSIDHACKHLDRMAEARPLGLSADQARALQVVYLLDQLIRLLSEGYEDDQDMVAWYRKVLARRTGSGGAR